MKLGQCLVKNTQKLLVLAHRLCFWCILCFFPGEFFTKVTIFFILLKPTYFMYLDVFVSKVTLDVRRKAPKDRR